MKTFVLILSFVSLNVLAEETTPAENLQTLVNDYKARIETCRFVNTAGQNGKPILLEERNRTSGCERPVKMCMGTFICDQNLQTPEERRTLTLSPIPIYCRANPDGSCPAVINCMMDNSFKSDEDPRVEGQASAARGREGGSRVDNQ